MLLVPRLRSQLLWPVKALRRALAYYNHSDSSPLFQYFSNAEWQPLIDSRIRKVLAKINTKMGLESNHFTFHAFRR